MRLDRLDPYLTTFTAAVTAMTDSADGVWVALDRSAFYPAAGGQPSDTGTLDDIAVVDAKEEGGVVWHLLANEAAPAGRSSAATESRGPGQVPLSVGAAVIGRIDWDRRFLHMQRHTGQHLLSQAFLRVGRALGADFGTKSVSLRGADCTLDLSGDPATGLDVDACARAEAEANEAARRAMPVSTFEVEEQYLHEYQLRRPSKVGGLVRLVAIGDYDLVACGGTHVHNSAELLPLAVLGSERVRGGLTRVTFRIGTEAVADAASKHSAVSRLGAALSSTVAELPSQVARLQAELAQAREALAAARAAAAAYVVDAAVLTGTAVAGARLVTIVLRDHEASMLDAFVDRLQSAHGVVGLCAAASGGKVRLAFTAGPATEIDVRPALNAALAVIEGRGGGRPDRAMGAGAGVAKLDEALAAAANVLGANERTT